MIQLILWCAVPLLLAAGGGQRSGALPKTRFDPLCGRDLFGGVTRVGRIWDLGVRITYVVYIRIRRINDVFTYTYLYEIRQKYTSYNTSYVYSHV